MAGERIDYIDYLKGLCLIWVVWYHTIHPWFVDLVSACLYSFSRLESFLGCIHKDICPKEAQPIDYSIHILHSNLLCISGWQFDDEDVYMPSNNKERLNIFGMVSPDSKYEGVDPTDSITGQKLAEWPNDYSKTIDKVTFVVLDNASIHRKGEVYKRRDEWKESGLYIFFLPTYSPHLNIAETVGRFLKGIWLKPHHYCSKSKLHEVTRGILDGIGIEYVINFSHAA